MPELLTPSQLAALRHHIAGGGQLGNGSAHALLATLDEMIGRLVEATLMLDSWAPCHQKGETAKLVQTYRAYLPPTAQAELAGLIARAAGGAL